MLCCLPEKPRTASAKARCPADSFGIGCGHSPPLLSAKRHTHVQRPPKPAARQTPSESGAASGCRSCQPNAIPTYSVRQSQPPGRLLRNRVRAQPAALVRQTPYPRTASAKVSRPADSFGIGCGHCPPLLSAKRHTHVRRPPKPAARQTPSELGAGTARLRRRCGRAWPCPPRRGGLPASGRAASRRR